MTLADISVDMQAFDALLAESDFDDPEVKKILTSWGNEIMDDLANKTDGYASLIKMMIDRAADRKAESKRLAGLAKTDENKAKALKEYLKGILEFHKVRKVDTPQFLVTVAINGGVQPLEMNILAEDLPNSIRIDTTTSKANTKLIREKLESGEDVDGCRLLERGTSLRIK